MTYAVYIYDLFADSCFGVTLSKLLIEIYLGFLAVKLPVTSGSDLESWVFCYFPDYLVAFHSLDSLIWSRVVKVSIGRIVVVVPSLSRLPLFSCDACVNLNNCCFILIHLDLSFLDSSSKTWFPLSSLAIFSYSLLVLVSWWVEEVLTFNFNLWIISSASSVFFFSIAFSAKSYDMCFSTCFL